MDGYIEVAIHVEVQGRLGIEIDTVREQALNASILEP